jgi:hypothetical protein
MVDSGYAPTVTCNRWQRCSDSLRRGAEQLGRLVNIDGDKWYRWWGERFREVEAVDCGSDAGGWHGDAQLLLRVK